MIRGLKADVIIMDEAQRTPENPCTEIAPPRTMPPFLNGRPTARFLYGNKSPEEVKLELGDYYTEKAKELFNVDTVTPEQRRAAQSALWGFAYGASAKKLTGFFIRDEFYDIHPEVPAWQAEIIKTWLELSKLPDECAEAWLRCKMKRGRRCNNPTPRPSEFCAWYGCDHEESGEHLIEMDCGV